MKNCKQSLLYAISIFILVLFSSSCTFEYHSKDEKRDNTNRSKTLKDVEVTENESTEFTGNKQILKSNKSVKKIKASFVDVSVKVRSGSFFINDGATDFVNAEFIYDKDKLKPAFEYMENKDRGDLNIDFTGIDNHDVDIDDDNTKCLLEFSNKVTMDMKIEFGAGHGKFNINNLDLEELEFRLGAGKFDIDLSNSLIKNLDIEAGVGEIKLDLTGSRKNDLDAEILGGIGKLDIKLPKDVGVRVEIKGILGDIDAYGFIKNDKVYTNKAYGNSKYTINLDVKAGMGDVNLFLID